METRQYKPEYTYLGIAAGGVYARMPNRYSKDTSVSVTIYDTKLSPYFGDMAENGIVVDKRPCIDHEDFVSAVVCGPMLQESLPPKSKRTWDGVVPCESAKDANSLDFISLDLYLDCWRALGACIGRRVGDTIEWESGLTVAIPLAEKRYEGSY